MLELFLYYFDTVDTFDTILQALWNRLVPEKDGKRAFAPVMLKRLKVYDTLNVKISSCKKHLLPSI